MEISEGELFPGEWEFMRGVGRMAQAIEGSIRTWVELIHIAQDSGVVYQLVAERLDGKR